MELDREMLASMIDLTAERLVAATEQLCALDWAIGDGDHGTNMKRGFEAVRARRDEFAALPPGEAFSAIGRTLVMTVGGASGPLYGSFFLAVGAAIDGGRRLPEDLAVIFEAGVEAVAARGRSHPGEKTMLDVLAPVLAALRADGAAPGTLNSVRSIARQAVERTAPMLASKGRAAYLGARSVGHVDPGAMSSRLIVEAVCDIVEKRL